MASDAKGPEDSDLNFSFGVSELRRAAAAPAPKISGSALPKAANENRGFDPYNTSGSFDRKKHWIRTGKR